MAGTAGRRAALAPLLRERVRRVVGVRKWSRSVLIRRVVAVALVLLAALLAMRGGTAQHTPKSPVVVAAKDLAPGTVLTATDVALRQFPDSVAPSGALHTIAAARGHTVTGAVGTGEPITGLRIVGPANTHLTSGDPHAVAVAVRLADPGVAALLRPGTHVDVIAVASGASPQQRRPDVLARDATVVTVKTTAGHDALEHGRLVVLALPPDTARRVAAASLRHAVTVTLR